jgi:hypothetical protein
MDLQSESMNSKPLPASIVSRDLDTQVCLLINVAIDSGSRIDWLKALAFPRDRVVRVIASVARTSLRSTLFNKLRDMFPDLKAASLVTRKVGSAAFGEDVFALANCFVEEKYSPELNRCLRVDAAILASVIELREGLYNLEKTVNSLLAARDTAPCVQRSYSGVVGERKLDDGVDCSAENVSTALATPGTAFQDSQSAQVDHQASPDINNGHGACETRLKTVIQPPQPIVPSLAGNSTSGVALQHARGVQSAQALDDGKGEFTTVPPRSSGRRGGKSFLFIYNAEKSVLVDDLKTNLQRAGHQVISIQKFTRALGKKSSFKVGLPELHVQELLLRQGASFLPKGSKLRLWSHDKPPRESGLTQRMGSASAARSHRDLRSMPQGDTTASAELFTLFSRVFSSFCTQAQKEPLSNTHRSNDGQ